MPVGGPIVPIFTGATISASGDLEITNISGSTIAIQYNIVGTPSGGPNLVFTVAEADPQNPTTTLTGGLSASTSAITSASSGQISISPVTSSAIKVSWTVTGTFPTSYVTVTALP